MFIDTNAKTVQNKGVNANQSVSSFAISNGDSISESDFIKLLQDEDQKEIEIAAKALHELLDVRERKIHEKSLRLMSGRIVDNRNSDGSYNIQPIGSFYEENNAKSVLNTGVWKGINSVCIFQNLEKGDEVLLLTNSVGNKVNSIIIGVYQQKSKDKFQNLINVVANLVADNKKLKKLEEDCTKYKKDISILKTTVQDLKSRITAIENMLDDSNDTTS